MTDRTPGAPLGNAKHEAFVRAIVEGMSGREAYRKAGYVKCNDRAADSNASRLLKNAEVSARIAELKDEAAKGAVMTAQQVLVEWSKIGSSNMQDYMRGGPGGSVYLDFSALTRDQAAALAEVTVEEFMDGAGDEARPVRKTKFKLHDKKGALDSLAQHYGLLKQKVELSGKDGGPIEADLSKQSVLAVARRIAFAMRLAQRESKAKPAAKPAAPETPTGT